MARWIYTITAAILAVLLVTMTGTAIGQKKPSLKHLKKTDPGQLYVVFLRGDDCPGTKAEYEKIVEGELLRGRIERLEYLDSWRRPIGEPYLLVRMQCAGDDDNMLWSISVFLAENRLADDPASDEYSIYTLVTFPGYGSFGLEPVIYRVSDTLKSKLREAIADALTDYQKANFPALSR